MQNGNCVSGNVGRAFNLGRSDGNAVAFPQHRVGSGRLAVDSDQVILGATVGQTFLEQSGDGHSLADFDLIGKAAAVVVDKQNLHKELLWMS
ncbi:MAG: hypothetical protein RLO18_28055 [Gimesia chilikensis]